MEPIRHAEAKAFGVVTRCVDVDDFIAKFHASCDETSMFVPTGSTRAIGHASPFIILLADKTPVMRGTCTVLEAWTDGDNPFGRPGIRIAIEQLTDASREIFERMLAAREGIEPLAKRQTERSATMIGFPVLRMAPARGDTAVDAGPQPVHDDPTERMSMPPAGVIDFGLARPLPSLPPRPSPVEIKVESSSGVKRTKGLRIATPCTSVDKFVETFHPCCESSSFFVATRAMRPVGLDTAFSIDLADGQPMLRGYCTVLEAWQTGANRFRRPGVLLGLKQLTADSRQLFDRLLAAGKAAADAIEAKPVVVVDRLTRPMVALGSAGERFAVPVIKPLTKPRTDATLPLVSPPPARVVATPAPAPVAPASVDDEWSAPANAEALPLPPPPAPIAGPVAPTEGGVEAAPVEAVPVVPDMPDEPEIPVEVVPPSHAPEPVEPLTIVAPAYYSLPAPIAVPVAALDAAPIVVAKPRPRRLAFTLTFVAGIMFGAVGGFTARPALAPTTTIVTAPAPVVTPTAPPPLVVEAPPTAVPVKTPADVPVDRAPARARDVRPPAPPVRPSPLAVAAKPRPVKRVAAPPKRSSACVDLSCL